MRNAVFNKRSLAVAGLAVTVAVAGQTVAGQAAANAAAAGLPAAGAHVTAAVTGATAGGPGRWSQVTASGTSTIADVGLVRGADGVLHVIWAEGGTGQQKIIDTPVGPGGTPGKQVAIASHLYLATDPDATATPGGLDVFWNGFEANAANAPQGTFEATRPVRGGAWKLSGSTPPLPAVPFTSSSDSAGTGSDGKPWVAFTGTDSLVVLHQGHHETQIPPTTGCCVYNPGFGTDGSAGATWLAYVSVIGGKEGVYAQRLSASGAAGAAVRLPGSETGGNVLLTAQRIGITGRGRGRPGVYAAYAAGYPFARSLDLVKMGTSTPIKVATFSGFSESLAGDTVTAGPNGRLWATWFDGDGTPAQLFVRASGTAGLSFGKTVKVALPAGTSVVYKAYTSAQAGRLDVVALLTRHNTTAYYATQVLLPPPVKAPKAAKVTATGLAMTVTSKAPAWRVVKSVPATRNGGAFTAVAATGKTTGVAFYGNEGSLEPQAWQLRGGTWTRQPFPGKNDEEVDVAGATSPDDVWAFTNGFSGSNTVDRVLHWNGRTWSVMRTFTGIISSASVLAANDVWVFGVGDQFAAWHYNGRTWTFDGTDVDSGSALGANDAWGYTGTFVEHWPGRKWVATNLAKLLPPKRQSNNPSLTGVIALSDSNVYAIGNGFALDRGGPTVILHFNGRTWSRVAEGDFGYGPPAQLGSSDGEGGLWLPTVFSVSHVPGTGHALAGGYVYPHPGSRVGAAAVILQYS